jgi:hypothetical protein
MALTNIWNAMPATATTRDLFSAEISNGHRRLKELATTIPHFKFLKTATISSRPVQSE